MFTKGRHENRISSLSFKAQSEDIWEDSRLAEKSPWWQRPLVQIGALSAAVVLALAGLMYWYEGQAALAAERVLEPDRVLSAVLEPQPIDPLLAEGENMRSPTRFREKTMMSEVSETDLYRGFLVLVNYNHLLPENYQPENLVIANDLVSGTKAAGLVVTKAAMGYNETAAERLFTMLDYAWEEEGIGNFLLQSGLRDFGYQSALHQNKIQEYRNMGYGAAEAAKAAAFWVARPRESEHHTGLAMDISSRSHPGLLLSYANDPNGAWLAGNCWRYGFIIRYQDDKSDITQIGFEPWHIRYVGLPHSLIMLEKNWCFEEYLAFIKETGGFTYRDGDGDIWQIDYQPMADGLVEVPAEMPYSISGDGEAGFVVTTLVLRNS